jgi:hypothetical protein
MEQDAMDFGAALAPLIGELVLALFGLVATILPTWVVLLWRKSLAHPVVQNAALWAAREAVARLRDPDDAGVQDMDAAVDLAAEALHARVPKALKRLGVADARGIVEARIGHMLYGAGQ